MIEDLLKTKRISQEEYEVYMLFAVSELGAKHLKRKVYETFMETPKVVPEMIKRDAFAFQDGRRDIFREYQLIINKVNQIIEEEQYDRRNNPERHEPEPE